MTMNTNGSDVPRMFFGCGTVEMCSGSIWREIEVTSLYPSGEGFAFTIPGDPQETLTSRCNVRNFRRRD